MSVFSKEVKKNEVINHSELEVFVIYDKVSKLYGLPVYYENVNVAVRNFKSIINKEGTIYHEHSADFDLVHIGVYNKDTCAFQNLGINVICNGFSLKQ